MKRNSLRNRIGQLVLCLSLSTPLLATTLYWDTNNDSAGSGNSGGTWDTGTTTNWSTSAEGDVARITFSLGDIAIFSAGTDGTGTWTTTVSGSVQPGGVTFKENGNKTIASGLIFVSSNPIFSAVGRDSNNQFVINSQLTGTGNITIAANGDTSNSGDGKSGYFSLGSTANDFTGNVTITSGVVNFSSDASFGNSANDIIIQGGGLLAVDNRTLPATRDIVLSGGGDKIFRIYGGKNLTIGGVISGTGLVRHTDGGTLILNAANTFTGNIDNVAGDLTLANSAHNGSVYMYAGTLSAKAGNTYTGITHMRGSNVLRLDDNNALPDTTTVLLYGGTTFNVSGKTDTIGSLTTGSAGDSNVIVNLGTAGILTVTNNTLPAGLTSGYSNATVAGKITGTGNITYNHISTAGGALHWDIANINNDYIGNWTVTSGRLRSVSDAVLGNAANDIIFNGAVVDTMNNNGGRASMQVTNGTSLTHGVGRDFIINAGKEGTFYVWGGTTQTIDGLVTGGGNLRKEDSGALLLNNTGNNYAGETKIVTGSVKLGTNEVLPNGTLLRIGGNGGTLETNGKTETITGLTSAQPSDSVLLTDGNVSGGGNLIVNGSGIYNFAGSFGGGNKTTLTMNGSGTQSLSGTRDNSSGWAVVNSGTLLLEKTSNAGVHAIGSNNETALTIAVGGVVKIVGTGGDQIYFNTLVTLHGIFDLAGSNEAFRGLSGSGTVTNSLAESTVTLGLGQNTEATSIDTFAGKIEDGAGILGFNKLGAGTLILTGSSTYSGYTDISEGTLVIDGTVSNSEVTAFGNGYLAGNGTIGDKVALYNKGGLKASITDWTGAAGSGFADLSVTGSITFDTEHRIVIKTTGLTHFTESNRVFPIATATGGILNFNASEFTISTVDFPGTGTWNVQVTGKKLELVYTKSSTDYSSWIASFGLTGANAAFGFDHDNDGISNGMEFVLGGDPTIANDVVLPTGTVTGTGEARMATVVFPRNRAAVYLNPILELSSDLEDWATAVNGEDGVVITVNPDFYRAGLDQVTVTLPAIYDRGFVRVSVTNP